MAIIEVQRWIGRGRYIEVQLSQCENCRWAVERIMPALLSGGAGGSDWYHERNGLAACATGDTTATPTY